MSYHCAQTSYGDVNSVFSHYRLAAQNDMLSRYRCEERLRARWFGHSGAHVEECMLKGVLIGSRNTGCAWYR